VNDLTLTPDEAAALYAYLTEDWQGFAAFAGEIGVDPAVTLAKIAGAMEPPP